MSDGARLCARVRLHAGIREPHAQARERSRGRQTSASRLRLLSLILVCVTTLIACTARTEETAPEISFTTADGGTIFADLYGDRGRPAVVLAHGAAFDKASWRALAQHLAARGHQVLAIDFRGYGHSTGGAAGIANASLFEDVLAAVRYLRRSGASRVAVVGASMGGGAAAEAAVRAAAGEIDRLVLLAPASVSDPERLRGIHCSTLVIATEHEPAIDRIRAQYERLPEPKRLVLLSGSAHAQHVFATDQAERLRATIAEFLAGLDSVDSATSGALDI